MLGEAVDVGEDVLNSGEVVVGGVEEELGGRILTVHLIAITTIVMLILPRPHVIHLIKVLLLQPLRIGQV